MKQHILAALLLLPYAAAIASEQPEHGWSTSLDPSMGKFGYAIGNHYYGLFATCQPGGRVVRLRVNVPPPRNTHRQWRVAIVWIDNESFQFVGGQFLNEFDGTWFVELSLRPGTADGFIRAIETGKTLKEPLSSRPSGLEGAASEARVFRTFCGL